MHIEETTKYEDFLGLRDDWNALYEESGVTHPFLSWPWLEIWIKHFDDLEQWIIITLRDESGKLVAAAPLTYTGKTLHFIGDPLLADYMDILHIPGTENETLPVLFNHLKLFRWNTLSLKRLHTERSYAETIQKTAQDTGFPADIQINCVSPSLPLEGNWESYFGSRSKGLRKDMRAALKKLEALGKVTFESIPYDKRDEIIDKLHEFHKNRQAGKVGDSLFDDEHTKKFLTDIARHPFADISVIKLDERVISVVYGLSGQDIYFYWIPSFDEEYTKLSLGKLHLQFLIERSFAENKNIFDFMIGQESYKTRWATESKENYEVTVYRTKKTAAFSRFKKSLRVRLKNCKDNSKFLSALWVKLSKLRT